jgi:hypothetical protein
LPALQVVSRVIASFPAARAAWAAATAALVARSAARLSMTPQGSRFLELAHEAALKYPGKVGRFEYHHIWPQFMGGPGNGPMILLPAPYHQMITTEFAQRAGGPLSPQAAQKIMIEVYTKYPIW